MKVSDNKTVVTGNSTETAPSNTVSRYLVEWQIIVWISILSIGIIANILNHIVLHKGFSDTVMVRFVKCMSTIDAAYCSLKMLYRIFKWLNFSHHKWLVQIYYHVILYGMFSL